MKSYYIDIDSDDFRQRIAPLIEAEGGTMPKVGICAVIEDDDGNLSFGYLHLAPHCAMIVNKKHRGTKVWLELAIKLRELDPGEAYVIADNPETVRLVEALGLERITAPAYRYKMKVKEVAA